MLSLTLDNSGPSVNTTAMLIDYIINCAEDDAGSIPLAEAERTPVWLMRQAGRYMKEFRAFSDKYPFRCLIVQPIAIGMIAVLKALSSRRKDPAHILSHQTIASNFPSFHPVVSECRMRSETSEIAIELSLQPWRAFRPDGVIMFSDILTPLPALGIEFDVVKVPTPSPLPASFLLSPFLSVLSLFPSRSSALCPPYLVDRGMSGGTTMIPLQGTGPVIGDPVRTMGSIKKLRPMDDPATRLPFVQETLRALREEVGNETTVLGFIGTPWTLAAYSMEGKADRQGRGRGSLRMASRELDPLITCALL